MLIFHLEQLRKADSIEDLMDDCLLNLHQLKKSGVSEPIFIEIRDFIESKLMNTR